MEGGEGGRWPVLGLCWVARFVERKFVPLWVAMVVRKAHTLAGPRQTFDLKGGKTFCDA